MKKFLVIIFCIAFTVSLCALGTLRVEFIKELPAEHMNLEVRDADGKFAPVLIVKTELKGLGFQNVSRPIIHAAEYIKGDHHYKFYMNDNQRVVKITHSDYEPLEVQILDDYGINVDAQRVYEIVLTNVPEKEFIMVNIVSDPPDAEKIIDGKNRGTGQSFELFIGSHSLKLHKSGYKGISNELEVSKSSTLFNNLTLPEVEPVMITIKSTPSEADIYINNMNEGKTNKQLFKFPDSYELRLVKDKFDTVAKTIIVTESGNNVFNYTLQKNTSILTINTTPSNCDIYLNNEKLNGKNKEISVGMYRIEVKKDGYYDQNRTVTVEEGKNKTETFKLEQKTGKLQFVVEPMESNVIFMKDGKTIDNWIGSKLLSSLPIGDYTISVTSNGYKNQTKIVKIRLEGTTKLNIILKKNNNEAILVEKLKNELNNKIEKEEQNNFNHSRVEVYNIKKNNNWNDTDSRLVAEQMIQDLMYRPWLNDFIKQENCKPILCVGVINSKTLDNQQSDVFVKDLERELINGGKIKFAALNNTENYQLCGADFIIQGTIKSKIEETGNKKAIYFQFDLELVNIKLNEKIWIGSKEIKKIISKPKPKW